MLLPITKSMPNKQKEAPHLTIQNIEIESSTETAFFSKQPNLNDLIQIARPMHEEATSERSKKKESSVVYRLFDKTPPFVYSTHKINDEVNFGENHLPAGKVQFGKFNHLLNFVLIILICM